ARSEQTPVDASASRAAPWRPACRNPRRVSRGAAHSATATAVAPARPAPAHSQCRRQRPSASARPASRRLRASSRIPAWGADGGAPGRASISRSGGNAGRRSRGGGGLGRAPVGNPSGDGIVIAGLVIVVYTVFRKRRGGRSSNGLSRTAGVDREVESAEHGASARPDPPERHSEGCTSEEIRRLISEFDRRGREEHEVAFALRRIWISRE